MSEKKIFEVIPGAVFQAIPAGGATLGSPKDEKGRFEDEKQKLHNFNAFRMMDTPVTFEMYDKFCEETGREKPDDQGWGRGSRPVINVSWFDARDFCEWVNQQLADDDHEYRLPTEWEWEYAARAGTQTAYYWGNDFDMDMCNAENKIGKTTPVRSYPANRWGLYDMSGNVWEWTSSNYENEDE